MILGERLKVCRKKKGYTQKQAADKAGVLHNSLSMYENNKFEPSLEVLVALANIYEVTVDYLLGRSNDPRLTQKQEQEVDGKTQETLEKLNRLDEHTRNVIQNTIDAFLKAQKKEL